MYHHRSAVNRDRWDPGYLGPLAWWTARADYVVMSAADPGGVEKWRNRIDGNAGLLEQTDTDFDPVWVANWRGNPSLRFDTLDANRMTVTSSTSSVTKAGGNDLVNAPFSMLMTIQPISTVEQIFGFWSNSTAPINQSTLSIGAESGNGNLTITRVDKTGSSTDVQGTLELGTAIRRVGFTFDGATCKTYIDGQQDLSTGLTLAGQLAFDRFKLGDDGAGGDGTDMYMSDFVVLGRAINVNEWLHYYEWSVGKWGAIKAPTFVSAGAGTDVLTSGVLAVPFPSGLASGDLFMLVVGSRQETTTPTTPGGWTLVYGPDTNPNATGRIYLRDARSDGTETGTFSLTTGNANMWAAQCLAFRGVNKTVTNDFLESASTTEVDGPGTLNAPTVSPKGYGRLAVAVVFVDNNPGIAPFSGGSGGIWAEASEYGTGTGSNFTLQTQVARIDGVSPITGGSLSLSGSDSAICRGFAMVGT